MESNKTRTDLLNFLIEKHGLKSYLEIGLQDAAQNFDKIKCDYKVSVDPDPKAKARFCCTSDFYFEGRKQYNNNVSKIDLIFIDGLHTAGQVRKDFENALKILSPKGFIVLHDCNPLKEEHTIVPRQNPTGHWHGDVYKFAAALLTNNNSWTVDIDCGCLVFQNKNNGQYATIRKTVDWQYFDKNRKQLLNLISWDEFVKK